MAHCWQDSDLQCSCQLLELVLVPVSNIRAGCQQAAWTQGSRCLSWGCRIAEILFQTSWLFGNEFHSQVPVVPEPVKFKLTRGCLLQLHQ